MLMLASGPKGVYDWLLPMLSRIGAPKYLGEDIAAGAIVKLVGQMKVFNGLQGSASAVAAHAAAFLSGVVGGEQQAAFFDFLNGGAGGTRQWDVAMRQGVADDVWDQGFMAEHAAVDAVYTAQMALEQGLPYEACVRPMLLMAAELAFIMTQYDGSLSLATHAIVKAFLAQSAGLLDDFLGNVLSKRGGSPEAVIQQVINALPVDVRQSVMLDITAADFAA
ncbi:MAG: hypothetical protein HN991_02365 [Candidatus Jacksonbacteria bacterium]|nr:hypothetical protein [Candidatus Jacksonbacteria bacterium]